MDIGLLSSPYGAIVENSGNDWREEHAIREYFQDVDTRFLSIATTQAFLEIANLAWRQI